MVIIFFYNNNKKNTKDYKLGSDTLVKPKFLGANNTNNNRNDNIYNINN